MNNLTKILKHNTFLLILGMVYIPIAGMENSAGYNTNTSFSLCLKSKEQQKLDALFIDAVAQKDIISAQKYLDEGASINAWNQDEVVIESTALHCACLLGDTEMVKFLLDQKDIDVNARDGHGNTPLHCACREDSTIEIVKLLLDHYNININAQANNKNTPLKDACRNGCTKIVTLLLDQKDIDLCGEESLLAAVRSKNVKTVELLFEHGTIFSPYSAIQWTQWSEKNEIKDCLNDAAKGFQAFIKNPYKTVLNYDYLLTYLITACWNSRGTIQYKSVMYLISEFYEFYRNDTIANDHLKKMLNQKLDIPTNNRFFKAYNFPKNPQDVEITNQLGRTLLQKEPYPEFDLNFEYLIDQN